MNNSHVISSILTFAAALAIAGSAHSQTFPTKPVRIIASEPGGGNDFAARVIANELTPTLGQQVLVDNRGGVIGTEQTARAAPDGYTLVLQGSVLWLLPFMRDNVAWDPVRDFAPVSLVTTSPNVVVVHPSLPAKSVKELIALAKARPGELNYAIGGLGSTPHLAAELFKSMTAINIVRINYKGGGAAFNDLIGGQVHLMFPTAGSVAPHLKSGRLRALAVTSARASPLVPGIPAVAAAVPGYETVSPFGIFAPAKTPAAVISRLNQALVQALHKPEVMERFLVSGVEAVGSSPEELANVVRSDMTRLGEVIRNAGIRAQ